MPERRGYIRAIAAEVPRIAATALGKRGFGEAQLVTQWDAIIGAEFAEKLWPERLNFQRGERSEGTLRLRVASAFAIEAPLWSGPWMKYQRFPEVFWMSTLPPN